MKKQNLNASSLANGKVLSRNEMKEVLGGGDGTTIGTIGGGSCTASLNCTNGTVISCTGVGGACNIIPNYSAIDRGWIQCDNDPKIYCD